MAASAAGFGAHAQEAAQPEANVPLPPIEVTTQKAAPKAKAKPKKSTASSTAAPVPQAAPAPAPPPPSPSSQAGLTPPSGNSLQGGTGLGRLPGTLQDLPQTTNVVSQQQIVEQKITTLDQALKNVPGVTVSIGEGGGGMNGDQFRIRGFQAKNDIYLDGLRDFGVYVRDAFAYEEVQVLKGPSSESFGMGTTGGIINTISKTAHLGNSKSVDVVYGSGPLYRSTVDVNQQIDAHTAMRVFAMINEQEVVDRDNSESNRWGVGASLAFGINTDTKLTLNYLYQHGDRTPDYGIPVLPRGGGAASVTNLAIPITEYAIPRTNFYGKDTDRDISNVHMLTSKFSQKVMSGVTVYNDTRLAFYDRDFASGPAECSGACLTNFQAGGNPQMTFGGGNPGFLQESWGIQNLTSVVARYNTGFLRHETVAGIDAFYQDDRRVQLSPLNASLTAGAPRGPLQNILSPTFGSSGYVIAPNPLGIGATAGTANNNGQKEADATDIAFFASERLWLTKEISLLGGARYDDYRASYRFWCNTNGDPNTTGGTVTAPCRTDDAWSDTVEANSKFWSPKLSFIWEPSTNETYYVSWAKATTPPGTSITNDTASIADPNGATAGNPILDPEESESYEVGGKISFLDGKFGISGAVFRIDKTNQTYTDTAGNSFQSGDAVRVQGFELGATGSLTDEWMVMAAYAYLDGEVTESPTVANIGHKAQQVPENNFNIWTTYDVSKLLALGPGVTVVGAGVNYSDGYFTNSGNTAWIPHNLSYDALVSYEFDGWRTALNGYNLTDELNYSSSQNNRVVPASGRSFVMSVSKQF
jgi:catecholate siderophore receptor